MWAWDVGFAMEMGAGRVEARDLGLDDWDVIGVLVLGVRHEERRDSGRDMRCESFMISVHF